VLYPYRCPRCRAIASSSRFTALGEQLPEICPHCGQFGGLERIVKVAVKKDTEAHFNHSLGRWVSNDREFNDGLKRAAEKSHNELGTSGDFVRVDVRDTDACGVTPEGLE
jgi:hypothetical protein